MAAYCFSLAWWSGWELASLLMPTRELFFLAMRIEYMTVVFIPTLFCATVAHLLKLPPSTKKHVLTPLYCISIVFLFPATLFPSRGFLWVTPGDLHYLPVWGLAGPYYWTFMVFFFSAVLTGHGLIGYGWYRTRGEERVRFLIFSGASVLAYLGGCPEFALKYGVRLGWLNPFGLYALPVYIGVLTYAVLRHQFLEIRVAIRRSLVYSILVTLLTVGYFGLVFGMERLFQTTLGYQSVWISLLAFAAMALAFQPMKLAVQRAVDWLVFRETKEGLAKRMERLEEQAFHAEKFRAISTMAAGMAHEIKNPLSALQTFAEFIPDKHKDPSFAKNLHGVLSSETQRIQKLVQEILDFAKPKRPKLQEIEPGRLISSTVDLLSSELLKRRVKWEVDCRHNGSAVSADPDQLRQILINLIQNAADAMPRGGKLTIATRQKNESVELIVSDTGEGIPKELLPKIFDPFVSTKPNGNGLGLAMVYSMVRANRGTIRVTSKPHQGTTFTVSLPL